MIRALPFGALVGMFGVLGCGAVSQDRASQDGAAGGTASDAAADADAALPFDPCRTPSGVRICGNGCGELDQSVCPGLGCLDALDIGSGKTTGAGVCLSDLPVPVLGCWFCPDGTTCVELEQQGLICVAEDVCRSLAALGAASACRYADFTVYDGRPLAVASGTDCPKRACGPGCGDCEGPVTRCSGRSADFGYGYCFDVITTDACSANEPMPFYCGACATWLAPTGGGDPALELGLCAEDSDCEEYEATGRMSCHGGG